MKVYKNKGLHFVNLNINSLQSKIVTLRELVITSNLTIVRITELKLDNSIDDCETCIEIYNIIRRDWNRKGGGVVCYVSNKICYNAKIAFQTK